MPNQSTQSLIAFIEKIEQNYVEPEWKTEDYEEYYRAKTLSDDEFLASYRERTHPSSHHELIGNHEYILFCKGRRVHKLNEADALELDSAIATLKSEESEFLTVFASHCFRPPSIWRKLPNELILKSSDRFEFDAWFINFLNHLKLGKIPPSTIPGITKWFRRFSYFYRISGAWCAYLPRALPIRGNEIARLGKMVAQLELMNHLERHLDRTWSTEERPINPNLLRGAIPHLLHYEACAAITDDFIRHFDTPSESGQSLLRHPDFS